ncbi:MAG: ATP-binding cassette domain-containing protein, partial [Proteobacteria bacterium]|nr:ATP-binding cassette domain-containing protein [Pseudomonadota bacterium]
KKGERIAIVGSSGGGKTTLVNLIPRFYDVTEGAILIDGKELRDISVKSLRSLIAIVTQETILFDDTVGNNIAYGRRETSEVDILQAAKAAYAHDFIMELPMGYDTEIGEKGLRLSGGQRQRLSIARAILKNAPILILDEATSALDPESEKLVQGALNNLMENRTSFVIAHRLSTIMDADRIVVMSKGSIVEEGKHNELLKSGGQYASLWKTQFADT